MICRVEGVQVLAAAVQAHTLIIPLNRVVVTGHVFVLVVTGLPGVLLYVWNDWVACVTGSWDQSI